MVGREGTSELIKAVGILAIGSYTLSAFFPGPIFSTILLQDWKTYTLLAVSSFLLYKEWY
jgi:hypothetical protein